MAITDEQMADLRRWAFEIGRDAAIPDEGDIVGAVFDRAEIENMRTEDEFDAIVTFDDMPAAEDEEDLHDEFLRGQRVREVIYLVLDLNTPVIDLRLATKFTPNVKTEDIDTAMEIIRKHDLKSVLDLTR